MKYHINPKTGEPGLCTAFIRDCKYALLSEHFESKSEAHAFYEKTQALALLPRKAVRDLSSSRWDSLFPAMTAAKSKTKTLTNEVKENPERRIVCPECGRRLGNALAALHFEEIGVQAECVKCGTIVSSIPSAGEVFPLIEPNPDSPTYLAAVESNVSKMLWYHWSHMSNWHEEAFGQEGPKRIHLGGERAAADRSISAEAGAPGYLYVVEIAHEALIDDSLYNEESKDFTVKDSNDSDAVRYLNMFEDLGSISLAIKPKAVHVIGYRKTDKRMMSNLSTYHLDDDIGEILAKRYPDGKM